MKLGWIRPSNAVTSDEDEAVDLARRSDVAIVFARTWEAESRDRASLGLPDNQNELISRVTAANPRTIVVLASGGPVTMPWLTQTPAVLQSYWGGQEQGRAIADVLFGDVNPSGKLPISYPLNEQQPEQLGIRNPMLNMADPNIRHMEGVFVGYRGYERNGARMQFPFGHGLSYTRFSYSDVAAQVRNGNEVSVSFTLKNTGTARAPRWPRSTRERCPRARRRRPSSWPAGRRSASTRTRAARSR